MYRQRIGCFSNTSLRTKLKKSHHGRKTTRLCPSLFLSLFLIIGTAFLFVQCSQGAASKILHKSSSFNTNVTSSAELGQWLSNNYADDVNFNARYKYGNRQKGGIKIMHWNAGGGFLKNKIHEIENVIAGYRPHLFGISETCFKKGHDISDIQIQDYQVYFSKTLENPSLEVSRVAVYVHKDIIKPKLRPDLMSDDCSSEC